jgi:hypothetical protein
VPLDGAARVVNVDHHATNPGAPTWPWVDPSYASASMMVAEVVDALGVAWDAQLATPCLAGLMTDTGHFRFGNTDRRALEAPAPDRRRRRLRRPLRPPAVAPPRLLPDARAVMAPCGSALDGASCSPTRPSRCARRSATARRRGRLRPAGPLRRGHAVAAILKERPGAVKVSVRSRGGVSARRICVALGGGGHDAAAGATLAGVDLAEAEARLLAAIARSSAAADPRAPVRRDGLTADGPRPGRARRARRRASMRACCARSSCSTSPSPTTSSSSSARPERPHRRDGRGQVAVVDALALLAGGRADAGVVRAGRRTPWCRRPGRAGPRRLRAPRRARERNVARIDGEVVTVAELRQALAPRLGIFGQHAFRPCSRARAARAARPPPRRGARRGARRATGAWAERLEAARAAWRRCARRPRPRAALDLLRYQVDEIDAAACGPARTPTSTPGSRAAARRARPRGVWRP